MSSARKPTNVFFDWLTVGGLGTLVLSALIFSSRLVVFGTFSIMLDCAYIGVAFYSTWRLAFLVFETKGLGHYSLTLWRLIDTFLGNLLGQYFVAIVLWKAGALARNYTVFSHTGNVGVVYASFDLFVYSCWLYNGGGVVDNVPVSELARAVSALQLVWNSMVFILILAAAVATLQTHTDEATSSPSSPSPPIVSASFPVWRRDEDAAFQKQMV